MSSTAKPSNETHESITSSRAPRAAPSVGSAPGKRRGRRLKTCQLSVDMRSRTWPALALLTVSLGSTAPLSQFGLVTHIDLGAAVTTFTTLSDTATMPLPLPNDNAFVGMQMFAQAFLAEQPTFTLAASPGVSLTIL